MIKRFATRFFAKRGALLDFPASIVWSFGEDRLGALPGHWPG